MLLMQESIRLELVIMSLNLKAMAEEYLIQCSLSADRKMSHEVLERVMLCKM